MQIRVDGVNSSKAYRVGQPNFLQRKNKSAVRETFEERLIAEIPALRRYGRVLCRDREVAEDLLQDCVERALRYHQLWRRTGSFRGWLFRIMHNIHANDARNAGRRPQTVPIVESELSATSAVQEMRVEIFEAFQAFERLTDDQRELMVLVVVEGFSYREAARILSVPPGTVMSRMARARQRLFEVMNERAPARIRRIK